MYDLVTWLRKEYGRSESLESHYGDESDLQIDANYTHEIRTLQHSHSRISQRSVSR